jgi:peptidyl-prolyl cis-trans isomerase C
MKKLLIAVALAATVATAAQAQNIAVVNGKAIPTSRLDAAIASVLARNPAAANITPEQKAELQKNLTEQLIKQEVLAQQAQKEGLENSVAYKNAIEFARQGVLVNLLVEDFAKKNKPTAAETKAEYDRVVAQAQSSGKEYKSRHILVEDEKLAKDLIAQLNKGAKFDALAKKYSKDPGSGAQGGDLGWADPAGYVPEFATALKGLEKGKMTQTPVKSSFGYHIIKLDDIREAQKPKIPPYDEVKDRIEQQMLSQKIQAFENNLREKATVK